MTAQAILIAGGYGLVGRLIAADLAADYPGQVIVAGRNLARAQATATSIGHGARGREIDVTVPSSIAGALGDVAAVMSCVDQPGRHLLLAAIERGLRYTDITPHLVELGRGAAYEKIDASARTCGACVVLGTGIVPGIANVMVLALAQELGGADSIETALMLSAGDATGPASFDYFLQELAMPFKVHVDGVDHPACSYSAPQPVEYPPPVGVRPGYLFPFSDQVLYPRTMGARTARTRLAIAPLMLSRLLAALVRLGAAPLIAKPSVRRAITQLRGGRAPEADTTFALRVDVTHKGQTGHATLLGHTQSAAAAAGAVGVLRPLLNGEVTKPGAWMPEQVIAAASFFTALANRGLHVVIGPVVRVR